MRLLLDTHIWLWSLGEQQRLVEHVRVELTSPENELWLSPISLWEALILHSKGRIRVEGDLSTWAADATEGLKEAPLTYQIAYAAHQLKLPHRDPADRFLAATALVLRLTLVSADERMLGLGEIATLANR